MRWSIIRVIWFRELRDQLRDRRTVVMMAVLPLVLYPVLGIGVFQFTQRRGKRLDGVRYLQISRGFVRARKRRHGLRGHCGLTAA